MLDVDGPSPTIKTKRKGLTVGATATTRINRRDFGLNYNSLIEAGPVVGDEITVTIDLEIMKMAGVDDLRCSRSCSFCCSPRPLPRTCRSGSTTPARRRSPISKRCSRISRAPTRSSSANSTTIPTRTGSSRRFSRVCPAGGVAVILSLEMFERDVQPSLDAYLAGTMPEEEFLKGARAVAALCDRLRPLVEFAKAHKLAVVAANVPRRIAADVAKVGLDRRRRRSSPRTDRSRRAISSARATTLLRPLRRAMGRIRSPTRPGAPTHWPRSGSTARSA